MSMDLISGPWPRTYSRIAETARPLGRLRASIPGNAAMPSHAAPTPATRAAVIRVRQDRDTARPLLPGRARADDTAQKKGAKWLPFHKRDIDRALRHFLALAFDGRVLVTFLDIFLNLVAGITAADH